MEKEPTLYQFTVTCGAQQVTLPAPNAARAIYDAAEQWGEKFKEIAGYCVAVRGGKARQPLCRECGSSFGKPGEPAGICASCAQIQAYRKREIARIKGPDRRARYGH